MEKQIEIIKRGAVDIVSESELIEKLKEKRPLIVKLGVDPTSPDLHLGHSVVLNKLRAFQDLGHKAVLIIGDFTSQVGDPSGRDTTRPVLPLEKIMENAKTYTDQAFKILDKNKTEVRFNSEWLKKFVSYDSDKIELFGVAKNITISRLLEREDFKNRMKNENPISLLEILYPIFQGYDSVAVKADVELGGQDQIFNLLVGRDLQKMYGMKPQICITVPLLIGTDGAKKMSKSYKNYIAFNDTPADIFGKIMSIPDELMYDYYELLTDADMKEVKNKHPMEAKKELAFIMVERFYDKENALKAKENFEKVFSANKIPDDILEFKLNTPSKLSQLIVFSGGAKSNNEARRLISSGAVRIDGEKVLEDKLIDKGGFVLQCGKRHFRKIV
ncbi:MAG TPA: tyrosine--tRNA ligase [Elusimicrobiales bacterium]|nr:tyrosine--tRNA ligase [Elusimicrobiales bacterium]HOL63399.1 tyrosine--tRNA ligase [Elusimicrobiales bacterium]HPO95727.1 tyrosine--tRNA ligase [Elusimicrobiales bacterium]